MLKRLFKRDKWCNELKYIGQVSGDERNHTDDISIFECTSCGKEKRFPFRFIGNEKTSDGSHTFEELYYHRMMLFAVICNQNKSRAWKSKLHDDGTMYDNYFIVGILTSEGQYSYHYHIKYWDLFEVATLKHAPLWDGHKPDDVGRLLELVKENKKSAKIKDSPKQVNGVAENEIISLLQAIREEIDHSKNTNKSAEVREFYLENAKRFTEEIESKLKGE